MFVLMVTVDVRNGYDTSNIDNLLGDVEEYARKKLDALVLADIREQQLSLFAWGDLPRVTWSTVRREVE